MPKIDLKDIADSVRSSAMNNANLTIGFNAKGEPKDWQKHEEAFWSSVLVMCDDLMGRNHVDHAPRELTSEEAVKVKKLIRY